MIEVVIPDELKPMFAERLKAYGGDESRYVQEVIAKDLTVTPRLMPPLTRLIGSMERRCKTLPNEETLRFLTVEEVKRLHLLALRMYLEDGNFRRIGRLLEVAPQTVINWVNASHAALKERGTTPPQPDTVETAELDELLTFVGSKKNGATSSLS